MTDNSACPFCAEASPTGIICIGAWSTRHPAMSRVYWVECTTCEARGPVAETEHQARAEWITRHKTGENPPGSPVETPAAR
jgi:hypothetical protein